MTIKRNVSWMWGETEHEEKCVLKFLRNVFFCISHILQCAEIADNGRNMKKCFINQQGNIPLRKRITLKENEKIIVIGVFISSPIGS
jgi:hypothetical protein